MNAEAERVPHCGCALRLSNVHLIVTFNFADWCRCRATLTSVNEKEKVRQVADSADSAAQEAADSQWFDCQN